jgi:hypothetical protein
LLGRDVLERAGEVWSLVRGALGGAAGEAEVGEVDGAVLSEQDVGRFDVSVDEPARMGGVEGAGDGADDGHGPLGLEPAFLLEHRAEIGAFDVAHGDVEQPVCLAGVEDRHDVRVIQAGGQLRLAQEALAKARVLRQFGGQQLQRHLALEAQLLGQVDDPHSATAEQRVDAVAGQLGATLQLGTREARHAGCTVTQTPPSPTAMSSGCPPTSIVATTLPVSGSMRETVPSRPFATHTEPAPAATP